MKTIFAFLFSGGLLLGCQDNELELKNGCYSGGLNAEYLMEDVKSQYVIQFPSYFLGKGIHREALTLELNGNQISKVIEGLKTIEKK